MYYFVVFYLLENTLGIQTLFSMIMMICVCLETWMYVCVWCSESTKDS